MKPLGTNSAVENELTTPKNAFGKPISQCELSTPEKTTFQRVDLLLNQQTHRAELQPRTNARLPSSVSAKEQKTAWTLAKLWI
ncbi:hypothetical protein ACXHP8_22775 [Vibrio antiquarius]